MVLITSNKSKQLLAVWYIGHVRAEELRENLDELLAQARELSPGFRLMSDFGPLEKMDADCATELGRAMESLKTAGVGLIVRVMPDPSKDIGLNILTAFHYPRDTRILTCKNLAEAADALRL